jgi:hypothetical protein
LQLLENLDNLQPAPKIDAPNGWRPAVEFDGSDGTATTSGFEADEKPNFDEFLKDRGYDPAEYEIDGNSIRTSQWQVASPWPAEPRWLTSYRFHFKKRTGPKLDLPLLYSEVKKTKTPKPHANKPLQLATLVQWADTQTGKVDHRGGTRELIERVNDKRSDLEAFIKKTKPDVLMFNDLGDGIEGFESGGNSMRTSDLSLMQMIDLETTMRWETLKMMSKYAPVIATSIGSNHCQWRQGKLKLGTANDDWGIHINRTLARLSHEKDLPIKFYEPEPFQEGLAIDVFGDGYHVPGFVHGHQVRTPDQIPNWWKGQCHGNQPLAGATMLFHGHWHHTYVRESGRIADRSKWIVGNPTLDNGSAFYRQTAGDDSDPGLLVLNLEAQKPFTGTVFKL